MLRMLLIIGCLCGGFLSLELNYSAAQEQLCVKRFQLVNQARRVPLGRALRIVDGDCPKGFNALGLVQGPVGPVGPAGPLLETLPSGQTLVGYYAVGGTAAGVDESFISHISFPFPLAAAPQVIVKEIGAADNANCPGTASEPAAAPGYLCLYEANRGATILNLDNYNRKDNSLVTRSDSTAFTVFGTSSATPFGAMISVVSKAAGFVRSSGKWAVTAP